MMRKAPSLVDLCVHLAIDNVRYLGDVGETDSHLLNRILCHCTLDQLTHIENSTVVRNFTRRFSNLNHISSDLPDLTSDLYSFLILLQDRDLSPVTDKLWKKFYKDSFGEDSFNTVVEKMRQKRVTFKWKQLYEVFDFTLLHK